MKLATCGCCGFQSKNQGWFYTIITGDVWCMRCKWKPLERYLGKYYESKKFTEAYNLWESAKNGPT